MSDTSFEDFFNQVNQTFDRLWQSTPSSPEEFYELSTSLHGAVNEFFDRITNGGTLPGASLLGVNRKEGPTIAGEVRCCRVGDVSPPSRSPRRLRGALLATGLLAAGSYYYYFYCYRNDRTLAAPHTIFFNKLFKKTKVNRKALLDKLELRKQVVLVLGADEGTPGRQLALDLENKGFVVIASVSTPEQVASLEALGRGFIKVLVLDALDATSVQPFVRSLNTALSLKFPLHVSGDPVAKSSERLKFVGAINALVLAQTCDLVPLEGISEDYLSARVGAYASVLVNVYNSLLPLMRAAISNVKSHSTPLSDVPFYVAALRFIKSSIFAVTDNSLAPAIVTLLPALHSNLAVPFNGTLSLQANVSKSVSHILRQELALTNAPNSIRVVCLETNATLVSGTLTDAVPALYQNTVETRRFFPASGNRRPKYSSTLAHQVFKSLVFNRNGATLLSGFYSHAISLVTAIAPYRIVDLFWTIQDKLLQGVFIYHKNSQERVQAVTGEHSIPDILRPGNSEKKPYSLSDSEPEMIDL